MTQSPAQCQLGRRLVGAMSGKREGGRGGFPTADGVGNLSIHGLERPEIAGGVASSPTEDTRCQ
jgi:hypothetical protein